MPTQILIVRQDGTDREVIREAKLGTSYASRLLEEYERLTENPENANRYQIDFK